MGVRQDKNNEERQAILREWDSWAKQYPTDSAHRGVQFFNHLENSHVRIIQFQIHHRR